MSYMTYEEGYKKIWSLFNDLRGNFDVFGYGSLVLYLITLHNNKGFRDSLEESGDHLTVTRLSSAVCGAVQSDETGRSRVLLDILDIMKPELDTTNIRNTESGYGSFGILSYMPFALEKTYSTICSISDEWYHEHLPQLFESILFALVENSGKKSGEFVQPKEVTRLVAALSGYEGHGSIYFPYAGAASYAVEMHPTGGIFGEEINGMSWALAVMRMLAHGLDANSIKLGDSIAEWQGFDSIRDGGKRFDFIVSTPPFLMMTSQRWREYNDSLRTFRRAEDDFLYRGSKSLKPNGTLVGILPHGILFRESSGEKELRRELVENRLVSKVIMLPSNLLYGTGIPSVIVQLSKSESDGTITMMDATSFYQKGKRRNVLLVDELLEALGEGNQRYVRKVSIEDVANKDYSLAPHKYFVDEETLPDGYALFRVSEVIASAKTEQASPDEIRGFVLNPADLSKAQFSAAIDPNALSHEELRGGVSRMSEPFIAVSRVGALRPTLINATVGSPVYFSSSISAFKLEREDVYLPLFLYEWRRKTDSLPELGITIRRTPIKDVLDLVLYLPGSIEEQRDLYARLENQDKLAKARELGLEEVISSQKRDYVNILRSRKHDLDNCLGAAKNDFSALAKSLKRMRMDGCDLVATPLADGLDITVGQQLDKIRQLLDKMSIQIKHFTDESVFGEAEKVDLIAKLNSIQAHGNYSVEHETDLAGESQDGNDGFGLSAFVRFNSTDLDRVLDNIISNAEKHGFKDPDFTYTLKISLSYDYTEKMYVVEFRNDGAPMPKGMDTYRYGIDGERGKDSDGEGKGGSIVKSIVEHFGGKYEVYNEPDDIFKVGILIKLPRYED